MRLPLRFAVLTAILVLAFQLFALPATAATCLFVPPAVTIDVGAGETATIGRTGADITLNGAACGGATVANTDTITITATGVPAEIVIDLTGGPLGPGLSPEADGSSEIEITVNVPNGVPTLRIIGAAGADHIVAGANGINLNADETTADADVTITGTPDLVIEGRDGEDHIVGNGGANLLDGGPGDDKIDGGGGDDTLIGGGGSDTVSFQSATEGVTVSLKKGTAEGNGADTLEGFENVVGTLKADEIRGDGAGNRIDGRRGPDRIFGGGGPDIIQGGDGNDVLFGQRGNDVLLGDSGKDQLDGGKGSQDVCKGGTSPDSFVSCETIKAGPPRLI